MGDAASLVVVDKSCVVCGAVAANSRNKVAPRFVGKKIDTIMCTNESVHLHVGRLLARSAIGKDRLLRPIERGALLCSSCVRGNDDESSCGSLLASASINKMCYGCGHDKIAMRTYTKVSKTKGSRVVSNPNRAGDGKVYCAACWILYGRSRGKKNGEKRVGQFCWHGKQRRERSKCKDCGGASICEHGRQRTQCKECGGGSICEHGRERRRCKECGGSGICEHGRERRRCKECKK